MKQPTFDASSASMARADETCARMEQPRSYRKNCGLYEPSGRREGVTGPRPTVTLDRKCSAPTVLFTDDTGAEVAHADSDQTTHQREEKSLQQKLDQNIGATGANGARSTDTRRQRG